jgi:hypothetical protein
MNVALQSACGHSLTHIEISQRNLNNWARVEPAINIYSIEEIPIDNNIFGSILPAAWVKVELSGYQ